MIGENKYYFYVAHVSGTDFFKIGTSRNPLARRNTAWHDAPLYIKDLICSALKCDIDRYTELKSNYHYVILELCSDKEAAKSLEHKFRNGIAAQKLFFRNGKVGDWFSLSPINMPVEKWWPNTVRAA